MALRFVFVGTTHVATIFCISAFAPEIRNVEDRVPDHDEMQTLDASDTS